MAAWLSQHSAFPVTVAQEGQQPTAGRVLLAGTSDHLVLKGPDRLGYTAEPADCHHRPSVDVFFKRRQTLAWRCAGRLVDRNGPRRAQGLKALRDQGHHTISQDQASCAVYGMPKAAAALKAAVDIVPITRIAARLTDVLSRKAAADNVMS